MWLCMFPNVALYSYVGALTHQKTEMGDDELYESVPEPSNKSDHSAV